MRSYLSNRHYAAGVFVVLSLLCGGVLGPSQSRADGALAVGLPPDVVKGGFTYGYSNNNADANHAEAKALDACRTTKDAANDVKSAVALQSHPGLQQPMCRGRHGSGSGNAGRRLGGGE